MNSGPDTPEGEELPVATYNEDASTPWQFSLSRTPDAIVMKQARGPEDKFDPVVKRYVIETKTLGSSPLEFEHTVIRRVWKEDPSSPEITSQRSEGRKVLLLYREGTDWHIDEPDPVTDEAPHDTDGAFDPTALPGVTVSTTYLRAQDDGELKFTEERTYRISQEILDAYETVYVLSCHEVNEESTSEALWEVDNAVAHTLVRA